MKNIILIGMMGCGKTTIGRLLARHLDRPFCDMDEYIEKKYQMSIDEMFAYGEDFFRDKETECVRDVSLLDGYVIATGGGVIKREHNMDLLKNKGFVIYIDRPVDCILSDIDLSCRPLLKDGSELYDLYKQRDVLYRQYCDIRVVNDGSVDELLVKILKVINDI